MQGSLVPVNLRSPIKNKVRYFCLYALLFKYQYFLRHFVWIVPIEFWAQIMNPVCVILEQCEFYSETYIHISRDGTYSRVPNNRAARLLIFLNFSLPTRLIWTYTLIKFQEKILPTRLLSTYTVIDFFSFFV
jgi:hypothetical protein